jgi:hypothetical protein
MRAGGLIIFLVPMLASALPARAADPTSLIRPRQPVAPFFQWNGNNGYCGETSLIQAGMNQGQWMSEYNARLICGTGLSQSGPDGFCTAHGDMANYNAQLLIENPNPGDSVFASAGLCLKNARLSYELYNYSAQPKGIDGYVHFMTWVKGQVIAGNQVTIGILNHGGSDPQYDHEVTVNQIGTFHAATDPAYYDDDVLYFDDHGNDGSSFRRGFTFGLLAQTRAGANEVSQDYSILIPGDSVLSATGGNGIDDNPNAITAADYAFSVSGPEDSDHVTLPVRLELVGSSTQGVANAPDAFDGYDFETPGVGECTNDPPGYWMGITLQVTVQGLVPGKAYNLYEYEFAGVSGVGADAALAVPTSRFNAHAASANRVTSFVASDTTYSEKIQSTSDRVIVYRCVPADAP